MLKKVFGDFLLLYKNFFHWNVSKILIYIAAFLFALLVSLPFFGIAIGIGFLDPVNWQQLFIYYHTNGTFPVTLIEEFSLHRGYVLGNSFLMLLGFLFAFIGFMQYLLTSSKLYLDYIDGEKTPFLGNIYFHFSFFRKYMAYLGWLGLILLAPILVCIFGTLILFFVFGGPTMVNESLGFPISTGILFVVNLAWFIYLAIRYGYGYLPIIDTKNYGELHSGWFYIQESKRLTHGNVWRIIGMTLLFAVCFYLPVTIIDNIVVEVLGNSYVMIAWGVLSFFIVSLTYEMIFTSIYRTLVSEKNQDIEV